jgi:hypothetical protein
MKPAGVKVPDHEEDAGPVTILDGRGRVIRVVPAEEFRRNHGVSGRPTIESRRRRKERVKTSEIGQDAIENDAIENVIGS